MLYPIRLWATTDDFEFVIIGKQATLLRSFWFGVYGAILMATVPPTILWVGGTPFEGLYWYWTLATAAGFVEFAVLNFVLERLGVYKINLFGRLKKRLSR